MSIYDTHKPNAGSGDYLKLKDGDRKKVRICSEPAVVTYDGKKLRYQWVLFNKTDKLAQVYEAGPQVFGQFAELYSEWGEPTEFDATISRTGSGQFDTNYTVTPSPKSEALTKDEQAKVDAVLGRFPSSKARMLADYEDDHRMPETIETNKQPVSETTPVRGQDTIVDVNDEEPINLDDIPF